jgi:hypothetical protein
MGGWCARNYAAEGTMTLTAIDAQNLRGYLAPLVEEWAKARHAPSRLRLETNRSNVDKADARALIDGTLSPAQFAHRQRQASWRIFRAHPKALVRAILHNVIEEAAAPFTLMPMHLPSRSPVRWTNDKLEALADSTWVLALQGVLIACALLIPRLRPGFGKSRGRRMRWFATLTLLLSFAFFALMAATTYGTGSRIIFPVQFAAIAAAMLGAQAIWEWLRPKFG